MKIWDIIGRFFLLLGMFILVRTIVDIWRGNLNPDVFVAPIEHVQVEPLRLDVTFCDDQNTVSNENIVVETDYGTLNFSSYGAALTAMNYKRNLDGVIQEFSVLPFNIDVKECQSFIVGLDDQSPYVYNKKEYLNNENEIIIVYSAQCDSGEIEKKFVINKHVQKIDLLITVIPCLGKIVRPRLIWRSPDAHIQENNASRILANNFISNTLLNDNKQNNVAGFLYNKSGGFLNFDINKIKYQEGYLNPTMFGSQDKYFVNVLVSDQNAFVNRAYFKRVDNILLSYIEAKPVSQTTQWNLSFYVGPKDRSAFAMVDSRLDKVLNYGFLAPLTKIMMLTLDFINGYVHNFGWSIIILTILIQAIFAVFSFGKKSQESNKMRDYQQRLEYIRIKHKDDKEAMGRAQAELLRQHGIPGSGMCLVMLFQVPILIALSSGLNNAFALYQAPFILWIHDLASYDPYYILPVIFGIFSFMGSIYSSPNASSRQRFMVAGLFLMLSALFATMASGLVLYFIIGAIYRYFESYWSQRKS